MYILYRESKMPNTQSTPQTSTLPNYHKISAPNFTQASLNVQSPAAQNKPPPVSNKPPPPPISNKPPPPVNNRPPPPVSNKPPLPVSNKPSHFTAPSEWKPPALPTVAQKVPPPKAPKPVSKPPMMPPPSTVNHLDASEKPSPSNKPDPQNELVQTDSSSSLDTGGQVPRSKSRLPPGLDIAVLTRIHPEFDYNAQDFAHKDSIDRRKKDQEANRPPVPMFSPDGSDTTREFVPPSGSHTELTQQTSMEEEKDRIMAYIKNRKVENKISSDSTDSFMCNVPVEVETKHQKKHQEKQLRKSLRNKLKRVMPNGREKRDKDGEMPNTNWQWGKDSAPPTSIAEVTSPSRFPPTSRETTISSTSSLPSSSEDNKNSNTTLVNPSNVDTRGNDVAAAASGGIRSSGVGMEVEHSSSMLPSQQHKDTSPLTTTITTTTAAVDHPPVSTQQQQQREWHTPSSSNRAIPPQTAPKPSPPIAPKPPILQKPVLKPHPFAAKKPSPPIAPKPQRDQLHNKLSHESEPMPVDRLRGEKPLQLQTLASR